MSAPNPLIAPTTSKVTTTLPDGQHADRVLLYAQPILTAAETVDVNIPNTGGSVVPLYLNGAPAQLTATVTSLDLPGGYIYIIVKNVTAGATGVDYQIKPRIGPH